MPLDFRPRRIWFLVLFAALIAIALGIIHRKMGTTVLPPEVSAKKEIPPPAVAPQRSLFGETGFASAALREISQLDGTITPAQWKALHPDEESRGERATPAQA